MMESLKPALQYYPFSGDFGDPLDDCFRDKLVTFRKSGPCAHCSGDVKAKTQGRSLTMYWSCDKVVRTYRYCTKCTEAMAKFIETDDFDLLDNRFAA